MSGSVVAQDSRELFRVAAIPYTVRDVIDAAFFRGELDAPWRDFLRAVESEKQAVDQEREPNDDAVDGAVQAFRYEHDLITAEETERWLAERGLTLSDFGDYFARRFWRQTIDASPRESISYHAAPAETREVFVAELTLSGELVRMATAFSWRLAAAAGEQPPPDAERISAQRHEFVERLKPTALSNWQLSAGRDEEWLSSMSVLEANFRIYCERLLTPQLRERELVTLRLPLTVFELEVIELDSHDAAREALLCVREDNMAMEDVATEGRYPFRREKLLLENIGADVQQRFLSANAGELMEPMELDGGHRLCRIIGKKEPDPQDPAVRARVEQQILDRHFTELSSRLVHWEIALS
jgi:hypothetical protein